MKMKYKCHKKLHFLHEKVSKKCRFKGMHLVRYISDADKHTCERQCRTEHKADTEHRIRCPQAAWGNLRVVFDHGHGLVQSGAPLLRALERFRAYDSIISIVRDGSLFRSAEKAAEEKSQHLSGALQLRINIAQKGRRRQNTVTE